MATRSAGPRSPAAFPASRRCPARRRGPLAAGAAPDGHDARDRMTLAPFGRRLLRVTKNERLGAYNMIWVAAPDGPSDPEPGQFYMLATEREWGGEDGRPYLPRAFSFARATDHALAFLL